MKEQTKELDLMAYLEAKGEKVIKQGRSYRHSVNDSLVIQGNKFYWNSRGVGGVGPIEFAKKYYGMTYPEAIKDVNRLDIKVFDKTNEEKPKKKESFVYPKENEVSRQTEMKDYLINTRKIAPQLVNWFIKKDLIAQDKRKNIIFKWREQGGKGKVIGGNKQGTYQKENTRSFKHIMPNEKEHTGFAVDVGKPEKLYVYEDVIDLMSHWSMKKNEIHNARMLSMHGLKPKTMVEEWRRAKNEGYPIKEIIIAVDNDDAGRTFIDTLKKHNIPHRTELPNAKDWNEELKGQSTALPPRIPSKPQVTKELERCV